MQLSLEHIEKELQGSELAPTTLADFRVFLAALYSWRANEIQKILALKLFIWLNIREKKNSDKAADREWQTTQKGAREMQLTWELRPIDKLSSAIASKLRVMDAEARNQM